MAPAVPRKPPHTSPPHTSPPPTSASASFNSTRLVRLLAELHQAEIPDPKQSLVERLGLWLGWTDAIALSAVLDGSAVRPLHSDPGTPFRSGEAARELAGLRASLGHAIRVDAVLAPRKPRLKLPAASVVTVEDGTDFSPYRRRCLAHQRAMETAIAPLRARARLSLETASPEARRLAALDAVLEQALLERENHLLASVPSRLEKRFGRLRQMQAPAGPTARADTDKDTDSAAAHDTPAPPPAWLAGFRLDVQAVLLAELEVRLQPVEGLIEALESAPHGALR